MGRILPNFVYALILTRSKLGFLHIIFPTVPQLWPLIYVRISFLLNILRTNGQNFTKFYICAFILTMSMLGLLLVIFFICNRVMALDLCPQNL